LLDLVDGGSTTLRNVGKYTPINTAVKISGLALFRAQLLSIFFNLKRDFQNSLNLQVVNTNSHGLTPPLITVSL